MAGSDPIAGPLDALRSRFFEGRVIPAHPLALDANRTLDVRRQRALSRYYLDAGAGGLAVGVHTTQFAIREAGLFERVLSLAAEEARTWTRLPEAAATGAPILVSGACGDTRQAIREARVARELGYDCALLSLAAMRGESDDALIAHCEAVADAIPLVGFYLQPAVGGIALSADFWARFAAIERVVAIKVAPFDRYRTLDVVRGVVASRAERRVALYTGNDDHIVLDLVTPFAVERGGEAVEVRFAGGLLGHWSVWTEGAVRLFARLREAVRSGAPLPADLARLDSRVTDCNAAFFDVANGFAGCIAGCHQVLANQGLLAGTWCLDPAEELSPGQARQIERVCREHADLADDAFVACHLDRWLSPS